jgi:putative membrane protein
MMMGLGLIILLLLIGAVSYAIGWRPQFNQTGPAQTSMTPVEILKSRYARGEINREEYDQIRRDLES